MEAAERTETARVTVLPMGSPIPEWLLCADPQVAGAPKGAWRFDVDVSIIELQDDFLVFPILPLGVQSTATIMDWTGMLQHHVYATSKAVRVIHQVNHIFPIQYTEAVRSMQAQAAQAATMQTANVVTVDRTDTHATPVPQQFPLTYWRRLCLATRRWFLAVAGS